jgi:hypothetical protein
MRSADSNSIRSELVNEARALGARIEAQREQAERLRVLAERIDSQTAVDEAALRDLKGALGEAAQLVIDDLDRRLGGQRLERVAIRLLRDRHGDAVEIHYREWFDLIRDGGYQVNGRDPLSTFLAQLNRSALVESAGPRSGRYRLRAA